MIKKGNVLQLKLIMRICKVPKYPLPELLKLSSTDRSAKCVKVIFNYYDYKQTELDDLLVSLCGSYMSDNNNYTRVNLLIDLGANVRYSDGNGNTALHAASGAGRHWCVVWLLQHPVNVNALNMDSHTPLMEACKNAPIPRNTMRVLINSGCDVDIQSGQGKTALHILSQRGMNLDLMPLLEFGADPNVRDVDGNTPLHLAVSSGSSSCVNTLLTIQSKNSVRKHTINVNATNNKGRTPLIEAYMNVSCPREIVQALFHAVSDANTQDIDGKTALHYAAENKLDLMPLLKFGADPNVRDVDGNTPLHLAVSSGSISCVNALLTIQSLNSVRKHTINVNATNNKGRTPLMEAYMNVSCPSEIVQALFHAVSDANTQDIDSKTAFHYAAENKLDLMPLLKFGAHPNVRDVDGNTPLHLAVSSGSSSCVNALLTIQSLNSVRKHTINVNATNNKGRTPLIEAYMNVSCPREIVPALFHAVSDANTQDIYGKTALHYATENKLDLMPLLKFGADPNVRDVDGNMPLHLAVSGGSISCVNALLTIQSLNSVRKHTINVNATNNKGRTPLIEAYMDRSCPSEIVQALFKAVSDANTQDIDGKTACHYAAENKLDLMPLLKFGADPNLSDNMGNTVLHVAASKGHFSGVRDLLKVSWTSISIRVGVNPTNCTSVSAKISLNAKNIKEQTPLILACMSRHHSEDIIKILVNAGSDVNTQDIDGKTALHYAAEYGLDLMPLLKFGADLSLKDNMGNTVLHKAATKGCLSGVRALLNSTTSTAKINVNATNFVEQTPLIIACMNHREDIIESLINAGCDVNIRDTDGGTALFYALNLDLNVSVLLDSGADPFVRHSSGSTAFELAVTQRRRDTTIELIRNNSVPKKIISFHNGWNLLNTALNNRSFAIARALLIGGYDRAPLVNWIQMLSLSDSWPDEDDEGGADMEWMMEYATNPLPLRHLSCLVIRRSINRRIVSSVEQLPLPRTLRDYVSLKDLLSCRA